MGFLKNYRKINHLFLCSPFCCCATRPPPLGTALLALLLLPLFGCCCMAALRFSDSALIWTENGGNRKFGWNLQHFPFLPATMFCCCWDSVDDEVTGYGTSGPCPCTVSAFAAMIGCCWDSVDDAVGPAFLVDAELTPWRAPGWPPFAAVVVALPPPPGTDLN